VKSPTAKELPQLRRFRDLIQSAPRRGSDLALTRILAHRYSMTAFKMWLMDESLQLTGGMASREIRSRKTISNPPGPHSLRGQTLTT
jgi:hypothetical protein